MDSWGIIWHHSIMEVSIEVPLSIFSPDPEQLTAISVVVSEESIVVKLIASSPSACCPVCTQPSRRVHSRYRRILVDLPSQDRAVRLDVSTRRWFCRNRTCHRRIFTERLPGVTSPYARRTTRLAILVEAIALALGGEGGVRVLDVLSLALSSDALLNIIRQAVEADMPDPEVVGIDDWSWRRGHRYGTIIVDLERHVVAELLPDRVVESVVEWLQRHPQINTIARDRSDIYAEAATKGAPQATQVADRWHLLHNLVKALEEYLLHHRAALREAATQVQQPKPEGDAVEAQAEPVGAMAVATRAEAATALEEDVSSPKLLRAGMSAGELA
jgi:transposase